MIILDWIKELLNNNKRTATIYAKQLVKKYGGSEKFEVGLYDGDKPLTGKTVTININGRDYDKVTDDSGIARLNINLGPGVYTPLISFKDDDYNLVTAFSKVIVQTDTRMDGTDINMIYKDGTVYQCAVYDNVGRVAGNVRLTVNGREYIRNCDIAGLYKLNINLEPGTYQITAEFLGDDYHLPSKVNNTIVVNPKPPEPEPEPPKPSYILKPYITEQGGGKLGQRTGYTCGPHSIMQCIYRLTGIELSEMELAGVCGTSSDGTDHDGLATGVAWFNRKYGFNLKMRWYNKSELSWDDIQNLINNGALFMHLLYRNQWGHYEVPQNSSSPLSILNSLGDSCGNGYCGYIESRSRGTQQSYINGISQKSVCVITRE